MRCARLDPSWLAALLAFLSLAAAPCCAAGSGDDQPPPQPAAGAGLAAKEEEVRSSYKSNVTFGEVIGAVCFALAPRRIAEFGVLDGFSLRALSASSPPDAAILAVDLFDGSDGESLGTFGACDVALTLEIDHRSAAAVRVRAL